LVLYLSWI